MALSSVRVLFNGKWTTLALNSSSGLYEGTVTAPSDPASGIPLTVRAVNGAGYQAEKSTTLDVRWEIVPPTVQITAPEDGSWSTNPRQLISFSLRDEEKGSGVDLDSLILTLDGVPIGIDASGFSYTAVSGGYDCVYTTPVAWSEGAHTVAISVQDMAGNVSEPATLHFHVDTLAPSLAVAWPPNGLMTNQAALTVSGTVGDSGSGLSTFTVNGMAVEPEDGAFSCTLALNEGTNTVTVTAVDTVGHEASIARTILLDTVPPQFVSLHIAPDLTAEPLGQAFVLTVVMAESVAAPKSPEIVTGTVNGDPAVFVEGPELTWTAKVPRADSDTYAVALEASDAAGNSAEYSALFPCGMESKWTWEPIDFLNFWDLNRIERNTNYIRLWMEERGYAPAVEAVKTDWTDLDIPTRSGVDRIRRNVDALQSAFLRLSEWRDIVYNKTINAEQMNAIEWDLHLLDLWLDLASNTMVPYSGQICAGMWP